MSRVNRSTCPRGGKLLGMFSSKGRTVRESIVIIRHALPDSHPPFHTAPPTTYGFVGTAPELAPHTSHQQ
ncbi:hypothetical protein BJX64DRAFT_257935 [Aspergillus heterothallicus]